MSAETISPRRRASSESFSWTFIALVILSSAVVSGCSPAANTANYDNRTFFREEYGLDTHGRKTWFDHLVELDPGRLNVHVAPDYDQVAPAKIAVLPF